MVVAAEVVQDIEDNSNPFFGFTIISRAKRTGKKNSFLLAHRFPGGKPGWLVTGGNKNNHRPCFLGGVFFRDEAFVFLVGGTVAREPALWNFRRALIRHAKHPVDPGFRGNEDAFSIAYFRGLCGERRTAKNQNNTDQVEKPKHDPTSPSRC